MSPKAILAAKMPFTGSFGLPCRLQQATATSILAPAASKNLASYKAWQPLEVINTLFPATCLGSLLRLCKHPPIHITTKLIVLHQRQRHICSALQQGQ